MDLILLGLNSWLYKIFSDKLFHSEISEKTNYNWKILWSADLGQENSQDKWKTLL